MTWINEVTVGGGNIFHMGDRFAIAFRGVGTVQNKEDFEAETLLSSQHSFLHHIITNPTSTTWGGSQGSTLEDGSAVTLSLPFAYLLWEPARAFLSILLTTTQEMDLTISGETEYSKAQISSQKWCAQGCTWLQRLAAQTKRCQCDRKTSTTAYRT